jgi:hypothetical protein
MILSGSLREGEREEREGRGEGLSRSRFLKLIVKEEMIRSLFTLS